MLSYESQASEVFFGPASTDKEIADLNLGKRAIARVVMNDHPASISMPIDALTTLAFRELKALVFEGSDNAASRDIAQERKRWMLGGHTVTATTG